MIKTLELGDTVITKKAITVMFNEEIDLGSLLEEHMKNWGPGPEEDAINVGNNHKRIETIYFACNGREIWIHTQVDRSKTNILLPEDDSYGYIPPNKDLEIKPMTTPA
jgi:hypothetical protein